MADALTADRVLGGRYRLLRQLARGGMATVWEAEDDVLGRRVAVKVLHPHLAADETFRERFRREGVAVARLSHPAVVAVFDTGDDEGIAYLVMELVDGRPLSDVLSDRGGLPIATAIEIVDQIAAGLAAAHERQIVHRDVKPGNVLLLDDGRAKITDFGIARGAAGSDLDEDLTRAGTIVGTAKYLAPEQVEGGEIGPRSDVYALGLVLYEALCGRPAFSAETELATALARTREPPLSPRQVRVDVPREVEAVVMRALARDPDDRFPSATEFRAALATLEIESSDPTPEAGIRLPAPSGDRRFTAGVAGVILVSVVVALLGFFFAGTEAGRSVLESVRERLPGRDAATPVEIVGAADFDPFGDGGEHGDEVGLAHDGDTSTAWRTDNYHTPAFGNLKPGVGLRLDVADTISFRRLTVQTSGEPWDGEVYVGDGSAGSIDDWGEPVATSSGNSTRATFDLGDAEGRSVLLWITHLPDSGQLEVAEVSLAD